MSTLPIEQQEAQQEEIAPITVICATCGSPETYFPNDSSDLCVKCRREKFEREQCLPCIGCAHLYAPGALNPDDLCDVCQREKDIANKATIIPTSAPPATLQTLHQVTNTDGDIHSLLGYNATDIKPKALEWLWPDKIPVGKITLLTGKPDCGKTLVLCDLIAHVTTGSDWPDGSKNIHGPQQVLMASSEDDPVDTLVPRLLAAGADLSRIRILDSVSVEEAMKDKFGKLVAMKKKQRRALLLTLHTKIIKSMLRQNPDIRLVALDPLTAYLGADANRDKDIRPVMEGMADACRGTKATIVGLIHHNKRSDVDALQKILGASSVAGVARAAWGFGRDPEDKDQCYMALVKGNLAKKRTGMHYRIEEASIPTEDGEILAPRIQWEGEMEEDANDMLSKERDSQKDHKDTKASQAEALLQRELVTGRKLARDMYALGLKELGADDSTMKRARYKIGGLCSQSKPYYWYLPGQESEDKVAKFSESNRVADPSEVI